MLSLTLVAWFEVSNPTYRVPLGKKIPLKSDVVNSCAHTILRRSTITNLHWYSPVSGCCTLGSTVPRLYARYDSLPVPEYTAVLQYTLNRGGGRYRLIETFFKVFRSKQYNFSIYSCACLYFFLPQMRFYYNSVKQVNPDDKCLMHLVPRKTHKLSVTYE